jgi:signal transduction histidine kinase
MTTENGGLRLTIADDGVGFDPSTLETRPGLGFVSMRERLRLVHGTINVQSAPAHGTQIEVWVPPNRLAS